MHFVCSHTTYRQGEILVRISIVCREDSTVAVHTLHIKVYTRSVTIAKELVQFWMSKKSWEFKLRHFAVNLTWKRLRQPMPQRRRKTNAADVLPWTQKKTILETRGEKNAFPSCDILLDHARSAQSKSRGWPCPPLITRDQAWYHKVEQCFSRRESWGWFFFFSFLFLSRVVCVFAGR